MDPDSLPNGTPEQILANKFLLMTPFEFNEWADKASIEEVERITAIISMANQQLKEQMECMEEELECEIEDQLSEDSLIEYFPEAQEILSKFTLNGLK